VVVSLHEPSKTINFPKIGSNPQSLPEVAKIQPNPEYFTSHPINILFSHVVFPSISSFRAFIMWCDLRRPSQARRIGTAVRLHRAGALQRERGAVRDQRGAARQGAQQQFACAACGDRGIAWVSIYGRY